ncbi:MAG TPA: metallophosphoesterase [Planctomycetota bacterium]|nr:metallophosphoesterase [Planctomycetota bacterium]
MPPLAFRPFFAVLVGLWFGLHAYAAWRLVRPSRLRGLARKAAYALVAVAAAAGPGGFFVMRSGLSSTWAGPIAAAAFTCVGLSTVTLMLLVAREAPRWTLRLAERLAAPFRRRRAANATAPADGAPRDPSRRLFLRRAGDAGVMASSGLVFGAGMHEARETPALNEVVVRTPDLPSALDGFRIVQLSDVHLGPTHGADFMARCVERANAARPDVIAVTGDLVDGFVDDLAPAAAPLAELRARHGAWFVTGNHEYYWDGDGWCREMERLGLGVLRNAHRTLEHDGARLVLAGVEDFAVRRQDPRKRCDPEAAFAGAPADAYRVLLAHQPKGVEQAIRAGAHLQVSGHTHGGQFFPVTLLIPMFEKYVAGLYRVRDPESGREGDLFVSRGTGSWGPPLRLGAPAEISVIVLRRG